MFWKIIGLSGDIASIASFPLVMIPVAAFYIWKERGLEMSKKLKGTLGMLFLVGLIAYCIDVADRFGFLKESKAFVALPTYANAECQILKEGIVAPSCIRTDNIRIVNLTFGLNQDRLFTVLLDKPLNEHPGAVKVTVNNERVIKGSFQLGDSRELAVVKVPKADLNFPATVLIEIWAFDSPRRQ
jgi:hypothetical protein